MLGFIKKIFGKNYEPVEKGIPHNQIHNGNYLTNKMLKVYGFSPKEIDGFHYQAVGDRHILVRYKDGYMVKRLSKKLKLHKRKISK